MSINFVAAIHLINMGKYEIAAEYLQKAIAAEEDNGNMDVAIEYTCVLGELFANMGERDKARGEFDKVLEYCRRTDSLSKQREIAQGYLNEFEEAERAKRSKKSGKKPKEADAKPRSSGNKPNTTQTSVFLQ